MLTKLYSLSISARATLDMHSLNNEGAEGNQSQTRMVNIVDQDGYLQNVNAISGDMFKHIQAEHLFHIVRENPDIPLCAGCREFNANRINFDSEFLTRTDGLSDAETTNDLLHTCVIDDIEGILITEGKRSLPRKSIVEFGWVIGIPEKVETDSYFHVRYASSDRNKSDESRASEATSGANLGQAIFYRPASSGIYAIVNHINLARIGFNDITQTYAISPEQRNLRARALLESITYTFIQPNGAMRSAQAPHLVNFEGVVCTSASAIPAPTVSPLRDTYRSDISNTCTSINRFHPDQIAVAEFDSLSDFTEVMGMLIESTTPYEISYQ